MRLLSLEIKNIRGIKSIKIDPNGENIVVYGPNGTGKSAVVDAVDFLVTGKIARLTGEGSKSLDIKEHGCHVDSRNDLKNTVVKAKVKFGLQEVTLTRSIAKPTTLIVEPKELEDTIQKLLSVTELGQHIMTRRDILQYITAEAGKRAKKIMSLLDLDSIEGLRQTLVALRNEAETEHNSNELALTHAKTNLSTLLALDTFSEVGVLEKVNSFRQVLDGVALTSLSVETVKRDLSSCPFNTTSNVMSADEITSTIKRARHSVAGSKDLVAQEAQLRALIVEAQQDDIIRKHLIYKNLISAGIKLVDTSNICPLCGRKWDDGDFSKFLIEKEKETEIAKEKQEKINQLSVSIKEQISLFENFIKNCANSLEQFNLNIINGEELKICFLTFLHGRML